MVLALLSSIPPYEFEVVLILCLNLLHSVQKPDVEEQNLVLNLVRNKTKTIKELQ